MATCKQLKCPYMEICNFWKITCLQTVQTLICTRVSAATLKPPSYGSQTLWLLVFTFLPQAGEKFSKINLPGGCYSHFSNERSWKFFFLLKIAEIPRGNNFRSENPFLMIKKWFWYNWIWIPGVNIGTQWTFPSWKDQLYDVISLKIEQQIFWHVAFLMVLFR